MNALFILGMHRSGTSALARVLNLRGVDLGQHLMAPASDNERGFWEHEGAVQIHEDLLTRLGHRWCDGTPLPEGWQDSEAAAQARALLAGVMDIDFRTATLWGVKDPRLSLLLPLWLPLLQERGIAPKLIVAWRNPWEVAASLQKRDAMEIDAALLCWLAYTLESLRFAIAEGLPPAIISYDELLADWRGSTDRLGRELGIEWPHYPEAEINAFLAPELRHHRQPERKANASVIVGLVEECLALLKAPEPQAIQALHARWQEAAAPFAPLLRQARLAETAQEERIATLEQEAAAATHRARDIEGQITRLYNEYTATLEREKEALVQQQMLRAALSRAETVVEEMRDSTSWKVTEPLRKAKKMLE